MISTVPQHDTLAARRCQLRSGPNLFRHDVRSNLANLHLPGHSEICVTAVIAVPFEGHLFGHAVDSIDPKAFVGAGWNDNTVNLTS